MFFAGCYKDKNNYIVDDVNEAQITTSTDDYAVMQLSELSIVPEITSSLHDKDSYTYEWKVIAPKEGNDYTGRVSYSEILSTAKDLKEVIFTPAGKYVLLYTVTNATTGIKNFKAFNLTVNSGFYKGLVVGYQKGNQAEMGFIREDGELGYDLIQTLNEEALQGDLQKVNTLIVNSLRRMAITTSTNHYQVDMDEFKILQSKNSLFNTTPVSFGNSYFGGNKMGAPYDGPSDVYYINNGKLQADMGPDFGGSMAGMYSQEFYYASGDYSLFPFLFNGNGAATIYFYDNLNGKFLQTGYNARTLTDVPRHAADKFDPSTVKKTAVAAMLGYDNNVYYVMQDGSDYYLYTMIQYNAHRAGASQMVNLSNAPDFAQARIFDARTDQRYIYYAVNNKLYLYNLTANSAQLVLTLAAGEEIADIHIYKTNMWQNTTDDTFNKRIYVASNRGDKGTVYQYGLLADGGLSNSSEKVFEGFGRIVDLDYRNAND
jgi:hypothetical protein